MKATRYAAVALTLALTSAVAVSFPAWAQPSDQASVPDFAQLEPI
jgi:hypothetical protein